MTGLLEATLSQFTEQKDSSSVEELEGVLLHAQTKSRQCWMEENTGNLLLVEGGLTVF